MTENQDKIAAIAAVVDAALSVDVTAESIEAQASGYEAIYTDFVKQYLAARDEGADQKSIAAAIQAEADAQGVKPHAGSTSSILYVDALADFYGLDGDLPTVAGITFVYRPAAQGALGVAEGEESVYSLIKRVSEPGDRRKALKAKGITYGKPVAVAAIRASKDKAEAIANLQALLRSYDKAVAEAKREERGPTKAEKYLKSATGPLSKVIVAIDADEYDDAAQVRELANTILAEVNAVLGHAKIKD